MRCLSACLSERVLVGSVSIDKIKVDGVLRSRTNALGQPIDHTEDGLLKFWRWFQNSCTIDEQGRPLVVYHGTNAMAYSGGESIRTFHTSSRGGAFFSSSEKIAREYGEAVYAAYVKIDEALVVDAKGAGWSSIDSSALINARVTDTVIKIKEKTRRELDAIMLELFGEGETVGRSQSAIRLSKLSDLPGIDTTVTETDHIAKVARRLGYSGVVIRNVIDSPTTDKFYSRNASDIYVAMSADNIKSIKNYGHWKNGDPLFCAATDTEEMPPFTNDHEHRP